MQHGSMPYIMLEYRFVEAVCVLRGGIMPHLDVRDVDIMKGTIFD